jgi:uncharacterized membrane protein
VDHNEKTGNIIEQIEKLGERYCVALLVAALALWAALKLNAPLPLQYVLALTAVLGVSGAFVAHSACVFSTEHLGAWRLPRSVMFWTTVAGLVLIGIQDRISPPAIDYDWEVFPLALLSGVATIRVVTSYYRSCAGQGATREAVTAVVAANGQEENAAWDR